MIFKQALIVVIVLFVVTPIAMANKREVRGGPPSNRSKRSRKLQNDKTSKSKGKGSSNRVVEDIKAGIVRGVSHRPKLESFNESFCQPPAVFVNMMTTSGSDTSDVRVHSVTNQNFTMFVQEEQSLDEEINHGRAEDVGYLALGSCESSPSAMVNKDGDVIGEVGRISLGETSSETFHDLKLRFSYFIDGPIVVLIAPNSFSGSGSDPFHIRVTSAKDASNIQYRLEEWSYLDQIHGPEELVYLVVKVGVHQLSNGKTLQGKIVDRVTHRFKQDFFGFFRPIFRGTPVVLSQPQTLNGSDPIVTRMKSASKNGIMIRLQEEEGGDGVHTEESIGMVMYGQG